MAEDITHQSKTGGLVPNRQALYSSAAVHAKEAIRVLADLMNDRRNPAVRMGAAKVLLSKVLPDMKAVEVSGLNGEDLQLVIKIIDDKPYDTNRTEHKELPPATGDIRITGEVQNSTEGETVRTDKGSSE